MSWYVLDVFVRVGLAFTCLLAVTVLLYATFGHMIQTKRLRPTIPPPQNPLAVAYAPRITEEPRRTRWVPAYRHKPLAAGSDLDDVIDMIELPAPTRPELRA